jgi:hypothetical protein
MKLGFKKTLLTAATATALLGLSGHAAAEIHAVSKLDLTNLSVGIDTGAPGSFGYTFTVGSSANLNNSGAEIDGRSCGTASGPACSAIAPVLTSVANGSGSTVNRAAGDYSVFGPGSGQTYANAASEIGEAQLATGALTTTSQISEVEIQNTGIGDAETTVGSRTTFRIDFSVGPSGTVSLSFNSDVLLETSIDSLDPDAEDGFGATAKVDTIFTLTGAGGVLVNWRPNGSTSGSPLEFQNCDGAVVCSEIADSASLNTQRTLDGVTNPDTRTYAENGSYQIVLTGLAAGGYTLQLTAQTFTDAEQRVPVPGVLGLMGIGLAGMGFRLRKQRKATKGATA